jgi:hypothetical protein
MSIHNSYIRVPAAAYYIIALTVISSIGAIIVRYSMHASHKRPKFGNSDIAARSDAGWARINEQSIYHNL